MSNLGWGLQMTVLGMGLVFAMLAILFALLHLVLRLDRTKPEPAVTSGSAEGNNAAAEGDAAIVRPGSAQGIDMNVLAAIAVAVAAYSAQQRRTAAPAMRTFWPGSQLHASRWVASGRARQNKIWQRKGR